MEVERRSLFVAEEISLANLKENIADLDAERDQLLERIAAIDEAKAAKQALITEAAKLGLIES